MPWTNGTMTPNRLRGTWHESLVALTFAATLMLALAPAARAQPFQLADIPEDGPVTTSFAPLDSFVKQHMATNQISAMTVAVMKNGRIMHMRGFGWHDYYSGDPRPVLADDVMRVASVTKFMAAAAVMKLVNDGTISLSDKVFECAQNGGPGLLPASTYSPFGGVLGDSRIANITVDDLIRHRGGWDRDKVYGANWPDNLFDPQFHAIDIADSMGIASPPGPVNTVNFMLGQPLRFAPGTSSGLCDGSFCYSNFGFMLLGLIVEEVTGMSTDAYLRANMLPTWGGASGDLKAGKSFKEDQDPREPTYYDNGVADAPNVFYPARGDQFVLEPYGGWEQEVFLGHGDLVTNTETVLEFLDRYAVWYDLDVGGLPIGSQLSSVTAWKYLTGAAHSGALPGTNAWAQQDSTGLRIAVIANRRNSTDTFVSDVAGFAYSLVNTPGFFYPLQFADIWMDFAFPITGSGTFVLPANNWTSALTLVQPGGWIKLKPGSSGPTPITLSFPCRLEAPLGQVTIGQ